MGNVAAAQPSRLKIAILLPDLRGGGAERVSLDLAQEFVRAGHAVEIVVMSAAGEFLEEARSSLDVVDLGIGRMRNVPWAVARYLRQSRPDALLAAMWPLTAGAGMARILSGHHCRVAIAEHGMLSIQYRDKGWLRRLALRLTMAWAYRVADAGIGVSQGVVDDIAELAWLPAERLSAINNAVVRRPAPDPEALNRADRLWGVPPGGRIMTVGRFKPIKNYPLMLNAFARLTREAEATLMLVGAGQDEPALRAQAQRLQIAERVIFAGFHADPTPFYQTADLFVLSSDSEGLPTVLVEALSNGLPVVSTDCRSGPAEILEHGKYGILVPVGDEVALANAIAESLSKIHDRDLLRARAGDFSPEKAASAYLKLLR